MKWISITTFYFYLFFLRGKKVEGMGLSFPMETVLPFWDVMKQSMFILTMTSIAGRFLSTSHSEYLIFVQAYMSQLLTLLDHFDCYFLYLFLTAILYFLIYLQTCGCLKFFCDHKKKESNKNAFLGMYPHSNWDAHGIFLRVLCFIQSSWRLISHGGCSPVWFLRHDYLDYGWHRNA